MLKRGATIIFLLIVAGLLIGQRFDFGWAGGEGYGYAVEVKVVEVAKVVKVDRVGMMRELAVDDWVARGEIIKTGDEARALLDIHGLKIGLDQRTDLKIEKIDEDRIRLQLIRGRIAIHKPDPETKLIIATKNTEAIMMSGTASFVNYDFKETVSVIPIDSAIEIRIFEKEFVTERPLDIHEVDPIDVSSVTFDATSSAAAEFYEWFEQSTQQPSSEVAIKQAS